jgi:O-antigen biosynthesis protein
MKTSHQPVKNSDFYEAKERLGLLTVGDPGSGDKLHVTDTVLISMARRLDNKIKQHPEFKQKLVRLRNLARKVKHKVTSSSSNPSPTTTPQVSENKPDIAGLIKGVSLPAFKKPDVSIVIPAFNKAEFSAACLKSIAEKLTAKNPSFEVILVDNGSSDDTPLLKDIANIVYIRNDENLGFVGGCNTGFEKAKGEYVIFLNNDAEVTETWLSALYDTIKNDPTVGIVGSKIIYPNGVLQEAGGIIFKDANGLNYGKFDQADSYQYNYVREVDYCSGASIIIKRDLMQKFGGFDPLYQPAYYEDTDLSFKVRREGLRVLYQPLSVIYHIEGGTAGTSTSSGFKKYQTINKEKFFKRWKKTLEASHVDERDHYLGRDRSGDKLALIIEEALPTPDKDSGSVRMVAMIKSLQSLGYKVTFWPNNLKKTVPYAENLQQMGVEVVYGNVDFMQFSRLYGHAYDLVIMSRPEICARYINICKTLYTNAKLVYDTVDLHYVRLARQAEIEKANAEQLNEQSKWYEILEKGLMQRVDVTLVVSEQEITILRSEGVTDALAVVSNIHTIDEQAYKKSYDTRKDIIFVGNYAHLPNRDAIRWFTSEIFPLITKKNSSIRLHVVGANMPKELEMELKAKNIQIDGFVSDEELAKLLDTSRVFLAPLRYGAGVKGKIGQSIEHALPVVTTSIGAEGMFIKDEESGLIADEPELFASQVLHLYSDKKLWGSVQKNAKAIIHDHFSREIATQNIKKALSD